LDLDAGHFETDGVYIPTCQIRTLAPRTNIFIDDVSLTDAIRYIRRFYVTDKYLLYSSVPINKSI
jgi:hypothetical protein